jgi:hypothetical protein
MMERRERVQARVWFGVVGTHPPCITSLSGSLSPPPLCGPAHLVLAEHRQQVLVVKLLQVGRQLAAHLHLRHLHVARLLLLLLLQGESGNSSEPISTTKPLRVLRKTHAV